MTDMKIAPVGLFPAGPPLSSVKSPLPTDQASFGDWLKASLSEVNQLRRDADAATQKLIVGESKDIHGTMIAMQKAGIAMDLVVEVRNKVLAAYEEVKRMQF